MVAAPVRYPRTPLLALLAVALVPVVGLTALLLWSDTKADEYELVDGGAETTSPVEAIDPGPPSAVLATSREPLSVPGETVWRVPSLGVPDSSLPSTVDSIGSADAARLFVDRARRARPDLVLSDEAAGAVARICVRLDGIPLSIELAAARCRNLAVEKIGCELVVRFGLLCGGGAFPVVTPAFLR